MSSYAPDRTLSSAGVVYRFGDCELRTESGEFYRNAARVPLQRQSLRVLAALLERPGAVVSREELRERLWPKGTFVDFEHSLNAAVKRLRAALDDDADHPRYVETLPRRGYRLIVEVETEQTNTGEGDASSPLPATAMKSIAGIYRRRGFVLGVAFMLLVLVVAMAVFVVFRLRRPAEELIDKQAAVAGNIVPPQKKQAYELYLRSLTYKAEPPDNAKAISLLERSAALDSEFVRSWYELGRRYDFEHNPGGNGVVFLQKAREANQRALGLNPDFSPARLQQVMLDVEVGQLAPAYKSALAMVQANPRDANAHFALSYVLRAGGLIEESGQECDEALNLDPVNAGFRSCGLVFILLGRLDQAPKFLDLDPLSSYVRFRKVELALLANNRAEALEIVRSIHLDPPRHYDEARLIEALLSGAPRQTVLDRSREAEAVYDRINMPEGYFVSARYQSIAGQTAPALRLLRRAIANNYCSFPAMESDPLLANVRRLPEYVELKRDGIACRENFRAQMRATRSPADGGSDQSKLWHRRGPD